MSWKKVIERIVLAVSVAGFFFRTGVGIYCIEEKGLESVFSGILSFIGVWIVYYIGRYIVKGFVDLEATSKKPDKDDTAEDESKKLWEKADGIIAGDIKIDISELLDFIPRLLHNTEQTGTEGKIDSRTTEQNLERISKLRAILRSMDKSS